jgi:hypothetical protein
MQANGTGTGSNAANAKQCSAVSKDPKENTVREKNQNPDRR